MSEEPSYHLSVAEILSEAIDLYVELLGCGYRPEAAKAAAISGTLEGATVDPEALRRGADDDGAPTPGDDELPL